VGDRIARILYIGDVFFFVIGSVELRNSVAKSGELVGTCLHLSTVYIPLNLHCP
jgi:hypothetical protein